MKKRTLFPLLTVALVATLMGCSNEEPTTTSDPTADASMNQGQTATPPGEDILGDGVVPDYGLDDTLRDDMTHMSDDIEHDMTDAKDDVKDDLTRMGDDMTFGIPYDEMVENGKVHDSDGILTDGENAKHDDFIRYD